MSNNPNGFDIPLLIPPLPSSSHGNKENDRKTRNLKESHDLSHKKESPGVLKSTSRSALGLRTPQTASRKALATTTGSHRAAASPSPGSLGSTTQTTKRRAVLRFGETIEFLFCITSDSSEEHRKLARSIVDGSKADDPKAWRQVLKLTAELPSTNGTDLIRLHRRATLRFPLDHMDPETCQDVIEIWLSFVLIHAKLGMLDEARRTCRYMENQKVPLCASFYMEVAKMEREHDPKQYQEVLIRGLAANAEPREILQHALDSLPNPAIVETSTRSSTRSLSSLPEKENTSLSPRKRKIENDTSPKRQKTETGFVPTTQPASEKDVLPATSQRPNLTFSKLGTKLTGNGHSNLSRSSSKSLVLDKPIHLDSKLSSTKPRRLASRLNPKGLSGKPKRVEPETSMYQESESETDSTCNDTTMNNTDVELPTSTSNPSSRSSVPKIKKIDLSYMWEWDPSARGKTQECKPRQPSMDKIEETSSSSTGQTTSASSQSHATTRSTETNTSSDNPASSDSSNKAKTTDRSNEFNAASRPTSPQLSEHVDEPRLANNAERADAASNDLLQNANKEFLPLVHENNILRVNGSSYVKLGVIGKGGSCKVYRALSKKCSVVAIKKVKLDGMDRKAIEGYANEVSLLKRLRGNPAIIQMYDSEVDLERKSIFVVMELGEADLNHILQQRALAGACRSLNMNFIRLTWQQMLSAVHCIHEERIIHSDLKPANFLFVRGALKLIDFGIAKAIQSDDTTNIYRENHIGTLNYMSPEAILDTETGSNGPRMRIGRASDVWSLGCILYEMVHGKTPFAKLHFIQKLQAIVNPNHPIEISDDVDEGAADAIRQCLQRNPDDRPPIVGKDGLLNEHRFLHSSTNRNSKKTT